MSIWATILTGRAIFFAGAACLWLAGQWDVVPPEWAKLKEFEASLRREARYAKALRLIQRAQELNPKALSDVMAKTFELAAERIASESPDQYGSLKVSLRTAFPSGPWGDRK